MCHWFHPLILFYLLAFNLKLLLFGNLIYLYSKELILIHLILLNLCSRESNFAQSHRYHSFQRWQDFYEYHFHTFVRICNLNIFKAFHSREGSTL